MELNTLQLAALPTSMGCDDWDSGSTGAEFEEAQCCTLEFPFSMATFKHDASLVETPLLPYSMAVS